MVAGPLGWIGVRLNASLLPGGQGQYNAVILTFSTFLLFKGEELKEVQGRTEIESA